jgi:hypothetical protein
LEAKKGDESSSAARQRPLEGKSELMSYAGTFSQDEDSDQDTFQISGRRVPVSGLLRHVSDAPEPMAVPAQAQGRGKPTGFSRG